VPHYSYFLENADQPITPAQPAWHYLLPTDRRSFQNAPAGHQAPSITLGHYFQAVRAFLEGPAQATVARALRGQDLAMGGAEEIGIYLAKHGECYHPARVAAQAGGTRIEWVVNVAVSPAGAAIIQNEFAVLQRLKREFSPSYLPQVYVLGEVQVQTGRPLSMFLGEWLAGFHEFHLTRSGPGDEMGVVLWDPENGNRILGRDQVKALYAQAARILTHYFNVATAECIGAWHHAAGDFVVNLAGHAPVARLITVREYRPLLQPESAPAGRGVKRLLEALLLFFLNLTIRMRLDRLDGVGEIVWAGPAAVEGALAGVLEALAEKPVLPDVPLPLDVLFTHYLLSGTPEELLEMCSGILASFHPHSPDTAVARAHLEEHAAALALALGRL
jgi:hypothetical protein